VIYLAELPHIDRSYSNDITFLSISNTSQHTWTLPIQTPNNNGR